MASPGDMHGVTMDEISKLTRAMKDDEFRAHMDEYTREVSDPAHRKEYIQYLEQLEAKGEMPEGQRLLRTQPGCCAKTAIRFKNGQTQKLFINIVHTDLLDDLSLRPADKGEGRQAHLPYSLSPPRPDRDLKDQYCMTADCAVSSYTFHQAIQNPQIMKMIVDTAADGLAERFLKGYEEVKKDWKLLERMKCKGGFPMPMSVRAELLKDKGASAPRSLKSAAQTDAVTPSELKEMRAEAKAKRDAHKNKGRTADDDEEEKPKPKPKVEEPAAGAPRIRVPKHRLIHSGSIDLSDYMESHGQQQVSTTTVPKSLRLVVELPTVKRSSDVSLEVTRDNVVVEVAEKFYLDLPLSYEVEDSKGVAKFDKSKSELSLELPVVPKPPIFRPEAAAAAAAAAPQDDGGISERGDGSDEEEGDAALGGDWIDRLPGAGAAAPPAEPPAAEAPPPAAPAAAEPERERLELDGGRTSLHIARPAPEAEQEPNMQDSVAEVDEDDGDGGEASAPSFVPAEAFEGARRGYFFSTGEEGLGYYRDRRQRLRRGAGEAAAAAGAAEAAPAASSMPLVEEVAPRPPPVVEVERPPLPGVLQRYLDLAGALGRRLPQEECQGAPPAAELQVVCHQTRQNLVLVVELPGAAEVADVQLAITGHRLAIAFATRSAAEAGAAWTRHRLRRTLCGLADARQWHAELVGGGGASPLRLQLVLRKVRKGEMWPHVLDADAPAPAPADEPVLASRAEEPAAATDATSAAVAADAGSGGGAAAPEEPAAEELHQDSAELDVSVADDAAAPASAAPSMASAAVMAGAAQVTATAAMVQSAVVMGQSVLLRNRLMYQLL